MLTADTCAEVRTGSTTILYCHLDKLTNTLLVENLEWVNLQDLLLHVGREEGSDVIYKCSREYDPLDEAGILWSDPQVAVAWPLEQVGIPVLSARDLAWPTLAQELKGAQE